MIGVLPEAKHKNNIIVTDILDVQPETGDDAVIRHRTIKTETPPLNPSVDVVDDEHRYRHLNRSQRYWLSIGENIGAWLVRRKTKP